MSAQPTKERVLFINIVHDGKVVQERAIPAGTPVLLGASDDATFVVPKTGLPEGAFPLFVFRDGAYFLQFTAAVKGKLTSKGDRVAIDKALADGELVARDGVYELPLDDNDKGKLRISPITVLFKFVEPAVVPAVAAPVEKHDFRPRWLDDDDPFFLGILAVWSALAILFVVLVQITPPPEMSLEDIPDRFTRIAFDPKPEPDEVVEEEEPEEDDAIAIAMPTEQARPADEPDAPKTEEERIEQAERVEEAKDKLQEESALFKELQARMIGSLGETTSGETVLVENAVGNYDNMGAKLAQAEASGASLGDGSKIRGKDGVVGGTGDRDIGGVAKGADGSGGVGLGAAPAAVAPKGNVTAGDLDFGGEALTNVQKVVRRYQGQLKYCYEKSLKANPSLAGRIVVGWVVEDGEAVDIYIAENTTGDDEIGQCIKGKVRRWAFTDVDDGDAKSTFVFTPQD